MRCRSRSISLDRMDGGQPSIGRHTLPGKLLYRFRVLRKMRQPHAAQHVRRLGELDIFVADDLDTVAPRVKEIEKLARQRRTPASANVRRTASLSSTTRPK